ncbi:Nucleotide-binding universal stress protein, UspA family [Persephonella hydrogeniphila]|uniref:Nucleotide-binding universal stress protein, UspA family n=2 Tax=Persephonella hydrogeniphila TaxID=198703 RepID=A0A285NGS5_9AQUI|nr:Nucleotide-binding universal stress protein, UspA family [Persephonella hydrogeniphila]
MVGRILVGIDGSKSSWTAADYGIYFSKKLKRPVVGVHIVDIRLLETPFIEDLAGALGFTTYADITPKLKEILDERGKALLDEFAQRCREAGADCSIAQAFGIVANELVDMADPEDLIIVGKTGIHNKFAPLFLGSTSEAVARKSKCPVMITTDRFMEIKNVILAFDGREKSVHAAQYLNEIYKDIGIENLTVITVFEEKSEEKEKHIKELLESNLDIPYELEFLYGYPDEELEKFILDNRNKYQLVTMGAYGESRIKELILGSTTSFIIHKSPIPVLLVK